MTWIAEIPLVRVYADGRRVPGQIAIGAPELVSDKRFHERPPSHS